VTEKRSAEDILREIIEEHYGLGKVEPPTPLAQAHQRRHRKLVVKSQMGEFLVKTYKRDPVVLDNLRFQHRLSDHLAKNGLPVAKIQQARSGRRIVELDTWALELQELVPGAPMEVTRETLTSSSIALGRFHQVCKDFPRPDRDTRMWRFSEVPRDSFSRFYQIALQYGDKASVDNHCNQIALFLHEAGQELGIEARSQFETGLIHGDWHSGNLIYQEDRLMAIVDLEFAGDGCFLEDLCYAISNLCIRTTLKEERLAKRVDILLEYYQKYRVLSFRELAALYYAVGVKHVATVSYQIQGDRHEVAGIGAAEWMGRLAFQCDWLRMRAKKVRFG
jgi:Ser/Thr protein kinase RdoA (MazF antagonist)